MSWISTLLTGTACLVFCLVENLSQSENLNLIFKSYSSSATDSVLWSIPFFPMLPATHQMFKAVTELGALESFCVFVQCRYEVQKSVKDDLSCLRTPKAIMIENLIKIIIHSFEKSFLALCYKGRVVTCSVYRAEVCSVYGFCLLCC